MHRSKSDMPSPRLLSALLALCALATCEAGPLGPLPNVTVTSAALGLKEGGCAVGDLVYLPGDEVPGAACERCRCAGGGAVTCARTRCAPRPGCKALHRPDSCCPTYQCECEQEGRVYGNGEKLVDPRDPCRVCYCQGGEVVCRRIACFLRDDCSPRLVPGRCCPEYDNCPLRGMTKVPGMTPSTSTTEDIVSSPLPPPPRENIKQEITIKEITPVSEIPSLPEVKVKEILPMPGIEVPDYSSSKSPLIVREATSENIITANAESKTESPLNTDMHSSSSSEAQSPEPSEVPFKSSENTADTITNDSPPSKFSLSTQDSINSEMYPSLVSSVATMGSPSIVPEVVLVASSSKAPIIEEEDPSLFDHNPAFPPLPDDLSVLGNHEDELVAEQVETEHVLVQEASNASVEPSTVIVTTITDNFVSNGDISTGEILTSVSKEISQTMAPTTFEIAETSTHLNNAQDLSTSSSDVPVSSSGVVNDVSTYSDVSTTNLESTFSTEITKVKDSPMLNLRSAIPTEILNIPSSVPEEITGELDDAETTSGTAKPAPASTSAVTISFIELGQNFTDTPKIPLEVETPKKVDVKVTSRPATTEADFTTTRSPEITAYPSTELTSQEQSTNEAKTNIVTEITAQTEFSSLPIETSDQNPRENSENIEKEKILASTADPALTEIPTTKVSTPFESEVITVSRPAPSSTDHESFENIETTEFVLTSFGSSESATDGVELIKISAGPDKSAAIIEPEKGKKNSVLTDLINLVDDVASIGDHTEGPDTLRPAAEVAPSAILVAPTATAGISDSEELIPVNAGYKSKNNNWNLNSITEVPIKSKGVPPATKQKVIEIEEDEAGITDSPPPNDKVEPTTRRPTIDTVADDGRPGNRSDNKDIEIITKSYVPTINRRPTKVVMKKNNDRSVVEEAVTDRMETTVLSSSASVESSSVSAVERASTTTTPPSPPPGPSPAELVTPGPLHY